MTALDPAQLLTRWAQAHEDELRPVVITAREILEEIRLAHHNLTVRAPANQGDHDQQYKLLYDGCVVGANALIHAYGYRASGAGGHRAALQAAAGLVRVMAGDATATTLAHVATTMRAKRHEAAYERLSAVAPEDLAFGRHVAETVVPVLCRLAASRAALDLDAAGIVFAGP